MELVRRFLLRQIPMYVDGGLNIVDVRDVADGHLLAEARGATGERYILGGRNFTLQRLFADLGRISGVAPPPAEAARRARRRRRAVPPSSSGCRPRSSGDETRSASLWWTYSSAKAKRELGFTPRPHEETLRVAVESMRDELGDRVFDDRPGLPLTALDAAARAGAGAGRLSPV